MDERGTMHWGYISAGLGTLAVMTIVGILIAANNNGQWLVAFLPLAAIVGGALLLAGREQA